MLERWVTAVLKVIARVFEGNSESKGDFLCALAFADQAQDFDFARGEEVETDLVFKIKLARRSRVGLRRRRFRHRLQNRSDLMRVEGYQFGEGAISATRAVLSREAVPAVVKLRFTTRAAVQAFTAFRRRVGGRTAMRAFFIGIEILGHVGIERLAGIDSERSIKWRKQFRGTAHALRRSQNQKTGGFSAQ